MAKRKVRVYSGPRYNTPTKLPDGTWAWRCPVIVSATSKKKAAEIAGVSVYQINEYWGGEETDEDIVALGLQHPEKLLIVENLYWRPLKVLGIYNHIRETSNEES